MFLNANPIDILNKNKLFKSDAILLLCSFVFYLPVILMNLSLTLIEK